MHPTMLYGISIPASLSVLTDDIQEEVAWSQVRQRHFQQRQRGPV